MATTVASSRGRIVALTGTRGFLGRSLITRLAREAWVEKVVAVDIRAPDEPQPPRVERVEIDLTQPSAGEDLAAELRRTSADTMIHLAFLSSPTHNRAWAHELEVIGTLHVHNACAAAGVRKLVQWSHTCVYGADPQNPNFLAEDHPLPSTPGSTFARDKIEADREAQRFAAKHPESIVTLLRTCNILGPTVQNYLTRTLSRRFVPTLLGFDPLLQFVHEEDALDAFGLALTQDHRGIFNIVGRGVLPLSTILKLAGRIAVPVPHVIAYPLTHFLWTSQAIEAPAPFLDFFRYLWVADGEKARRILGFTPRYGTKDAVMAYVRASAPVSSPAAPPATTDGGAGGSAPR